MLDPDNVENTIALWACGFTWSEAVLERAVDELVPYGRQSLSLSSGIKLKSHARMLDKLNKRAPAKLEPPAV